MASVKISDLTAKTDIESTDLLVIETSGGLSRKTTPAAIFTRISAAESNIAALSTSTAAKTASYVITDVDDISRVEVDTTSGDVTITLPLKANNTGRIITIANIKGGTNKVIISPNATDANKLTADGLNVLWLPKIGDYISFKECATSGFWEVIDERVTCRGVFDTYAGYGGTDNKIVRFTNAAIIGNLFSENHSTGYSSNAKGLEITVSRSGRYAITYIEGRNNGATRVSGVSVNSSQLTTSVISITAANRLSLAWTPSSASALGASSSVEIYLSKNDVLRAHSDGVVPATASKSKFTVIYLG